VRVNWTFACRDRGKQVRSAWKALSLRQANNGMWNKLFSGIIPKLKPELRVGVIEGDYIDIEYTNADIVRGNVVIIGQGCSIGRVEYRSKLSVHPRCYNYEGGEG
jgi:hypothetical protein